MQVRSVHRIYTLTFHAEILGSPTKLAYSQPVWMQLKRILHPLLRTLTTTSLSHWKPQVGTH